VAPEQLAVDLLEQRQVQAPLVAEVVHHGRALDADFGRDVVHAGPCVATFGEDRLGGSQYRLPRFLAARSHPPRIV
jgi:hypothetical protein